MLDGERKAKGFPREWKALEGGGPWGAKVDIELKRDWRDWLFAGPGLWWLWLLCPFVGSVAVLRGLYVSATRSFAPVHILLKAFWTIWLSSTALLVYLQLAN